HRRPLETGEEPRRRDAVAFLQPEPASDREREVRAREADAHAGHELHRVLVQLAEGRYRARVAVHLGNADDAIAVPFTPRLAPQRDADAAAPEDLVVELEVAPVHALPEEVARVGRERD